MIKKLIKVEASKVTMVIRADPGQEGSDPFWPSRSVQCPLLRGDCTADCCSFSEDDENYYCASCGIEPDGLIGKKFKE